MNTAAVLKNVICCQAPSLRAQLADLWRAVFKDMFSPYRPEKHYMRGPGPKWLERHANQLIYSQSLPSTKAADLTDQDGTRSPFAVNFEHPALSDSAIQRWQRTSALLRRQNSQQ